MEAGSVPYTILRATQFFEFLGRIADSVTEGEVVRVPPVLVQPEAVDDVAEPFRLDELARRIVDAGNDPRRVTPDPHARHFGTELDDRSLVPGESPRIAPMRFEDWLAISTAGG